MKSDQAEELFKTIFDFIAKTSCQVDVEQYLELCVKITNCLKEKKQSQPQIQVLEKGSCESRKQFTEQIQFGRSSNQNQLTIQEFLVQQLESIKQKQIQQDDLQEESNKDQFTESLEQTNQQHTNDTTVRIDIETNQNDDNFQNYAIFSSELPCYSMATSITPQSILVEETKNRKGEVIKNSKVQSADHCCKASFSPNSIGISINTRGQISYGDLHTPEQSELPFANVEEICDNQLYTNDADDDCCELTILKRCRNEKPYARRFINRKPEDAHKESGAGAVNIDSNISLQYQTTQIEEFIKSFSYVEERYRKQIFVELKKHKCYVTRCFSTGKKGGEADVFYGKIFTPERSFQECFIRIITEERGPEKSSDEEFKIIRDINDSTNIIRCFKSISFVIGDQQFYAYFLERAKFDLSQEIKNKHEDNEQYSFERVCQIIFDLLDGLVELRSFQIIHSDIKPDNILINSQDEYVYTDFGVAIKSTEGSGTCRGYTRKYSSPEQGYGTKISHASDIYNLGKVYLTLIETNKQIIKVENTEQERCLNVLAQTIKLRMLAEKEQDRSDCLSLIKIFYDIVKPTMKKEDHDRVFNYSKKIEKILKQNRFNKSKDNIYLSSIKQVLSLLDLQILLEAHNFFTPLKSQHLQEVILKIIEEFDLISSNDHSLNFTQFLIFIQVIIISYNTKFSIKTHEIENQSLTNLDLKYISQTLFHMGVCKQKQSEYESALKFFEQSLEMRRQQPDPIQSGIATSLNAIGVCYQKLGDLQKALSFFQNSYDMKMELYNKQNHIDIASSLSSMGTCYLEMTNFNSALQFHTQALEMRVNLYNGGDHPEIADSLNDIGMSHMKLGQREVALNRFFESREMKQRIFNGNHATIADTLNNIGNCYVLFGKYQDGLDYCKKSLEMRQQLYKGMDHHDIAQSLSSVASRYHDLGLIKEAQLFHEQSLEIKKKLYKTLNHFEIATTLSFLATQYRVQGNKYKALIYNLFSLSIRKSLNSDMDNLEIAYSYNGLGNDYFFLGDIKQALIYYQKSYTIRKAKLPSNNFYLIASVHRLGLVYFNLGKFSIALKYFDSALKSYEQCAKDEDYKTAFYLLQIAACQFKLGNTMNSLKSYVRVLEISKKYPIFHKKPVTAVSLLHFSSCYCLLGDIEMANIYYEESIDIFKQMLKDDSPALLQQLRNLNFEDCFIGLPFSSEFDTTQLFQLEKIIFLLMRIKLIEETFLIETDQSL